MTFNIYRIDQAGEEIETEVEVEYSRSKARRGARDSCCGVRGAGAPLEPDEPEEVEILSVTDSAGNEVTLTPKEEDEIYEKIYEQD